MAMERAQSDPELERKYSEDVEADTKALPSGSLDLVKDTVEAAREYTEADFKRILRKTDMWLIPIMWIAYGIQQADKNGLSTQATFGIRQDTHLQGQQYSWLSTIFFIGYIAGEIPANVIMQKTSIRQSLGISMLIWGGIVMATAGAKNWAGLMVLRFLQGVFESIISPAFLLITGMWYKKEEQAARALIWGLANSGFTIVTSLCMYGIGRAAQNNPGGMAPWKGMSYFLGGLTFLIAVIMYCCFGSPREVFWMTEEDRRIQAARVVANSTGTDRQKRAEWKWDQVWVCAKDPQSYFFFFVTVINIPTGGVNSFANLIYTSFGFTPLQTLLKGTIPQSAFIVFWFASCAVVLSRWQNKRFIVMIFSAMVAFAGMLGCGMLQRHPGHLWAKWGCYLITGPGAVCGCIIWTLHPSDIAGRTKKSVTSVLIFFAYCTGNALGAQVFQARWAPTYTPAIVILAVFYCLEMCLFGVWMGYYIWKNKQRRAALAARGVSEEERQRLAEVAAEQDVTDYENEYFIYTY